MPSSPGTRQLDAQGSNHEGRVFDAGRKVWRTATDEELSQAASEELEARDNAVP